MCSSDLPSGAVVPAFQLLEAVNKGTLDGGHGVVAYHYGKQSALALWGSGPGYGMVNCLKQIAQFGIEKQIHVAGLQQELESLEAMPPEARVGIWMFEWYWKQSGVPGVEKFVADIRKMNGGKVPTARHWFGFTSVHTLASVANKEKTLDAKKLAEALGGFELADDIKLQPNKCYYRKGDHQLMPTCWMTVPSCTREMHANWPLMRVAFVP